MPQSRIFEHPLRVLPGDIDELGRVNNVVYLRYAQDAATAHWFAAATPEQTSNYVWVVRRHEVDYLKPALPDDELIARTWVGASSGATYDRHVEIRRPKDDALLVRVKSTWVLLDATTLRPRRVTDDLRARFEDLPTELA